MDMPLERGRLANGDSLGRTPWPTLPASVFELPLTLFGLRFEFG